MDIWIHGAWAYPNKLNKKRSPQKNIIAKLSKVKYKEIILVQHKKCKVTFEEILIRLSEDFLTETLQTKRECDDIFKLMKEKKKPCQPKLLYPKWNFWNEREIKYF
jgi:hypothetical protein